MARIIPAEQQEWHLAEAEGWLDEKDPFFDTINSIARNRRKHTPRSLKRRPAK